MNPYQRAFVHARTVVACLALSFVYFSEARAQSETTPEDSTLSGLDQVLALLEKLERGDEADRRNLEALVSSVRNNSEIPAHDRFAIVSRARDLSIRETVGLTRGQRLAAYEQSARDMLGEFPDQPEPYAALLALANDQPTSEGAERLAQEILTLNAPDEIKAGAQRLLDRLALVGEPLELYIDDGQGIPFNLAEHRGKVVVLYAWSGQGKNSHLWLRSLLARSRDGVEMVGLNFDPDRPAAIRKAAEVALGSRQFYDPTGFSGDLAKKLCLTRVPAIYLIDRDGVVRNVWALADFPTLLSALVEEGGRS